MFNNIAQAWAYLQEHQFKMVEFKFSDLAGPWHHLTIPASQFNEQLRRDGIGFDASSIGLKPLTWCSCPI